MNYVDPAVVTSPKTKVSNVEVIRDGGEWGWSVVKLHWENEPALGIRWNGSYDEQPKGLPQSHGFPTWFVLPAELHDNVLEYCAKNNPNMVMINPPSLESIYDQANQIRKSLKVNPLPDLRAVFDDASAEWTNSPYDKKTQRIEKNSRLWSWRAKQRVRNVLNDVRRKTRHIGAFSICHIGVDGMFAQKKITACTSLQEKSERILIT